MITKARQRLLGTVIPKHQVTTSRCVAQLIDGRLCGEVIRWTFSYEAHEYYGGCLECGSLYIASRLPGYKITLQAFGTGAIEEGNPRKINEAYQAEHVWK